MMLVLMFLIVNYLSYELKQFPAHFSLLFHTTVICVLSPYCSAASTLQWFPAKLKSLFLYHNLTSTVFLSNQLSHWRT